MARAPSRDPSHTKPAWSSRAIRWVFHPPRRCPSCRSREVRYSKRRTFLDSALGFLLLAPYRCLDCRKRFFRPTLPGEHGPVNLAHRPVPSNKVDPSFIPPPPLTTPALSSILILDSDPAIRRLLRRLLERSGYFVTEMSAGANLAVKLDSRRVDLLIADFALPPQEAMASSARLLESHPGLKVILLSSQPLEPVKPPVTAVLLKPFHNDALLDEVHKALGDAGSSPVEVGKAAK